MATTLRFTHPALTDADGKPRVFRLPAQTIVCPSCRGAGQHFRADLDENRMIELIEQDGDEDEMEHYRRGAYDQTCTECHGRNVVAAVDWDAFAVSFPKAARKMYAWDRSVSQDAAYAASERACGA